ncbi:hypothetical protein [Sphingomonas sp.]|jgi:hypothetical protein|uniref:hypothetical protein n=1 Tax=Sphingomonas sp. TaxID=28214 RepID=UPI002E0E0E90|nr:hypothetical protein [Sphingomonas sp.]
MVRAPITAEGVLNAIAEFDALGRATFLDRYGFNGARDYFLVHEGRRYDSKAIAAVAHKWAPGGDGRALTALELSGGRNDAAKLLLGLGFTVTDPDQNADWSWDEHVLALDLYMTNPASPPGKGSKAVAELSVFLNRLGKQNGVAMTDKFRNANGVYMKMMNFRRLDPAFQSQGKVGLGRGSKGEQAVWDQYAADRMALSAAASAIKATIGQDYSLASAHTHTDRMLSRLPFEKAFAEFQRSILAREGGPFRNFQEGVAAAWEGYKPRLREIARELLAPQSWSAEQVGNGTILEHAIAAIEVQDQRFNVVNNLVFWQNRFGHANRDHRAFLEARSNPQLRRGLEELLFTLYRSDADEGQVFDALSELTGGKYPLLAYLFFLKDMDRFTPIQPTGFDQAFRALDVDLVTLRNCSWENYQRFNAALGEVREALAEVDGLGSTRLIDAHSFCWLLVKLPVQDAGGGKWRQEAGRVIGGREKSIIAMRYSIMNTARTANGQIVERTLKNKELLMSPQELEKLLATLLELQDNRCALTGIPFHFHGPDADRHLLPSPDRIDSSGHYAAGNLQIVCQFVNFWKRDTEIEEFKRLLMLVRGIDEPV